MEEKIGERIGWNREKVRDHVTLRSKIGAEILIFAKSFQEGRAPKNGAAAPKNERSVTLRSRIGAEILVFAKAFQKGRAPTFGAIAPKNERGVTSGLSGEAGGGCVVTSTKTCNRQPFP